MTKSIHEFASFIVCVSLSLFLSLWCSSVFVSLSAIVLFCVFTLFLSLLFILSPPPVPSLFLLYIFSSSNRLVCFAAFKRLILFISLFLSFTFFLVVRKFLNLATRTQKKNSNEFLCMVSIWDWNTPMIVVSTTELAVDQNHIIAFKVLTTLRYVLVM